MNWVCLEDGRTLEPSGEGLDCPRCGRRYPAPAGLPIFAHDPDAAARLHHATPAVEALEREAALSGLEQVARRYCEAHSCSRFRLGADWKLLVASPIDGRVVELGAGLGDDTVELAERTAETVALVPDLGRARLVRRRLDEAAASAAVAVVAGLARLPLPDRSVAVLLVEDAVSCGFSFSARRFGSIAREWYRVLAPGGTLLCGMPNVWAPTNGLGLVRAPPPGRRRPECLERLVKRESLAGPGRAPALPRAIAALCRAGFAPPTLHAPLPGPWSIELVLPLDDAEIACYCLDHLVRRNSLFARAGLLAARFAVKLHVVRFCVPYVFLRGKKEKRGQVK